MLKEETLKEGLGLPPEVEDIEDAITPSSVASKCYKEANGDVIKAVKLMEARVLNDHYLYNLLTRPLVRDACYDAIRRCCRSSRSAIYNMPQPSAAEEKARISAHSRTLMDFPLPSGKRLGDATGAEVGIAADFYKKQAKDMTGKAKWLSAIRRRVPDEAIVDKTLTPEDLSEMKG